MTGCIHKWKRTGERHVTVNPIWFLECELCGVSAKEHTNDDGSTHSIQILEEYSLFNEDHQRILNRFTKGI